MATDGFNKNVEIDDVVKNAIINMQFTAAVIRYLSEPSQYTSSELIDLAFQNMQFNNEIIRG